MSFGEARQGPTLRGYPYSLRTELGVQRIRPLLLDALEKDLAPFNISWTATKFVEATREQIPDKPGVYYFCVSPKAANIKEHHIILYVGKAKGSLRKRYSDYLSERNALNGRDKIVNMLNIYKNRITFSYCCLDGYDVERIEDHLIDAFDPPCNTRVTASQSAF